SMAFRGRVDSRSENHDERTGYPMGANPHCRSRSLLAWETTVAAGIEFPVHLCKSRTQFAAMGFESGRRIAAIRREIHRRPGEVRLRTVVLAHHTTFSIARSQRHVMVLSDLESHWKETHRKNIAMPATNRRTRRLEL